jgi:hypothetical protein
LSRRFPAVVRVVLAPARAWAAMVAVVHGLAMAAAIRWLPLPAAVLVCAGLAVSGWHGIASALLRGPHAVREIELRSDGSAAYVDGFGEWKSAGVDGAASLGHRFAALRLRAGKERRNVILVHGAASPADLRRARVWARLRLPGA